VGRGCGKCDWVDPSLLISNVAPADVVDTLSPEVGGADGERAPDIFESRNRENGEKEGGEGGSKERSESREDWVKTVVQDHEWEIVDLERDWSEIGEPWEEGVVDEEYLRGKVAVADDGESEGWGGKNGCMLS